MATSTNSSAGEKIYLAYFVYICNQIFLVLYTQVSFRYETIYKRHKVSNKRTCLTHFSSFIRGISDFRNRNKTF
jgi:hypothetical protein